MKKIFFLALAFGLLLSQGAWKSAAGQTGEQPQKVTPERAGERPQRVTLYSPLKYRHDQSRAFFSFTRGALAGRGESWEVGYGTMYLGKHFDWLTVSSARDSRSVIRDLGAHGWGDSFKVPFVGPMPVSLAGGRRYNVMNSRGEIVRSSTPPVTVASKPASTPTPSTLPDAVRPPDFTDASRARTFPTVTGGNPPNVHAGHSLPSGARGLGQSSDNASGVGSGAIDFWPQPTSPPPLREAKGDVVSVKAVVGHMYVVHVVDGASDYYALLRVEAVERGDNCTITWKVVPAPPRHD
jgi:hypothetical protein